MDRKRVDLALRHRLTDTENRLRQAQFGSRVIEKYMSLVQPPDLRSLMKDITFKLEAIQSQLAQVQNSIFMKHEYKNARAISELRVDEVETTKDNFKIAKIVSKLRSTYKTEIGMDTKIDERCIASDWTLLCTFLDAVRKLLPETIELITVSLFPETLSISFRDKVIVTLKPGMDAVDQFMEMHFLPEDQINDAILFLYIARCIAAAKDGDLDLNGDTLIATFNVEAGDASHCDAHSDEDSGLGRIRLDNTTTAQTSPTGSITSISREQQDLSHGQSGAQDVKEGGTQGNSPESPDSGRRVDRPHRSSSITSSKSIEGRSLTILLAEDGKILQDIFKRFWSSKGHTVIIANDGQEALEIFKMRRLSIIFLDIEMPIKNGMIVAQEIRDFEKKGNMERIPIVGITGHSKEKYQQKAIESGMDVFLTKGSGYPYKEIERIVIEKCGV